MSSESYLDKEAVIEALLFVASEPLTVEKIVEVFALSDMQLESSEIRQLIKGLMRKWNDESKSHGRGITLNHVAGGYLFSTNSDFAPFVKKLINVKPLELSKAQIEVLSIVAYRQPITRIDVDEIRGVDSSFAIKRLMQLKLLKILGKSEGLGRPLLYGTTKYFLEFFSLASLNDLPTLTQFDSLGAEEEKNLDGNDAQVSFKDLFENKSSLISNDVMQKSEEALKNLDEALLRIDGVEKGAPQKID